MADFVDWNETIRTATEVGTFVFMLFTTWRVSRVADKLNETHKLTNEIAVHTNSLTARLVDRTDAAAEARGIEKGIAQQLATNIDTNIPSIAVAAAEAAATVLAVAAELAAKKIADELAAAKSVQP